MGKMSSNEAYQNAKDLIDAQLRALPPAMSRALDSTPVMDISADQWRALLPARRGQTGQDTGSVGNIVAQAAQESAKFADHLAQAFSLTVEDQTEYLRTTIGNALLAVGMFLEEHDMAAMRTPEIQFLDHVCAAILNGNRFLLEPGYMPIASFDGLVIDDRLDGTLLFDQNGQTGFMGWGDAIALLMWLRSYLDGTQHFVTGGDAG